MSPARLVMVAHRLVAFLGNPFQRFVVSRCFQSKNKSCGGSSSVRHESAPRMRTKPGNRDSSLGVRFLSTKTAQVIIRIGLPHQHRPPSRFLTFSTVSPHLSLVALFRATSAHRILWPSERSPLRQPYCLPATFPLLSLWLALVIHSTRK